MTRLPRRLVLAVLALTPASCSGLLPQGAAPPKLYTLTPASDFPADGIRVSWQLLVDVPASPAALDSERIALSRGPTTIDYFADAAWTDRAPLMLQSLLVQSFENSGRIGAIARESLALRADYILLAEVRDFEAEYAGAAAPVAHLQLGVKLIRMPDRAIVAQQRFDATAPAAANQMPAIVEAFNTAFHQAARQIVDWALATGG
ncbi:MAG TPA: ABC-type transport auxiliary lipoprotein family protein [Stellaceae bacterium]|nr:ABC-type transport auxiliary lipoprotein family protein [Stellaceae bacterium]